MDCVVRSVHEIFLSITGCGSTSSNYHALHYGWVTGPSGVQSTVDSYCKVGVCQKLWCLNSADASIQSGAGWHPDFGALCTAYCLEMSSERRC